MSEPGQTFLDSVRVLDLSRILAGPLAAQMLGDLGAEVLKIENPDGGDDTRAWGPPHQAEQAAYFQSCNRNKSSLALDLKNPSDYDKLIHLVREADVCIDNFPPQLRQRLRVDGHTLLAENPRLVVVNISAFAEATSRADERGYDLALQAESGWIALNGDDTGMGFKVGVAVVDVLTASMASNAALAALFARERSGRGQGVQVSLYQTALFSLVNVASNYLVSGQPTKRWGNAHPNIVPYQAFACRDRNIVIAVGNDRQFAELGLELCLDPKWSGMNNAERSRQREPLVHEISSRASLRDADDLIVRLRARGIPCAPILRADEALRRPEASLVAIEHPRHGTVRTVGSPITGPGMRTQHVAPPALGEGGTDVSRNWLANPRHDKPRRGQGQCQEGQGQGHSHHMSPQSFRQHGHALVDWLAQYMERVEDLPVQSRCQPGAVRARLPARAPDCGEPFDAMLRDVEDIILPGITHWQSPNFFAYFPANTSGPSILGELLSAGLGVQGMLWATSPACTELETHVLDWLVDMLGLPPRFLSSGAGGGVIQDSASSAVLCALLAARERDQARYQTRDRDQTQGERRHQASRVDAKGPTHTPRTMMVYASREAHSSVQKAVRIAGLRPEQCVLVDTDGQHRLDVTALRARIEADKDAGRCPAFVCATLGSTSSQAVDPLPEIGRLCLEHDIWLHVDGAMTGTAALCPEFRDLQAGLEYADSYTFNPHKWMFTNFDCNCMFVADRVPLLASLSILPEYLRNEPTDSGTVIDYRDWQIPLGRRFRALKLWFVIRHYGVEGLQQHVREHVRLATEFCQWVRDDQRFIVAAEPTLNLVCLRHVAGNDVTRTILERINASGAAFLSHTTLDGRYVIRVCIAQTHTTRRHVANLWTQIQSLA